MHTLDGLKAAPSCAVGEVEVVMAAMLHGASVEVTGPHDDTGGTVSITLYCRRDPRLVAKPDIYGNIRLTPGLLRFYADLPEDAKAAPEPPAYKQGSGFAPACPPGHATVILSAHGENPTRVVSLTPEDEAKLILWLLAHSSLYTAPIGQVPGSETCATCVHGHDLDRKEGSMVVCGPQHKAHDRTYCCSGYRRITINELTERDYAEMGVQRGSS